MSTEIYYEVSRAYRAIRKYDDQYDFGTVVIDKMTLNSSTFPSPPIPISGTGTTLTSINNGYLAKINAAKGGDHDAIVARDTYRDETWIPAFDETADYVENDVANGDQNIILKSGFQPTKGVKDHATLPKQMHLDIKSLNKGELTYKSDTTEIGKDANYLLVCGGRGLSNIDFSQDADGKLVIETKEPTKIYIAPLRNKKGTIKGLPSEEKMSAVIVGVNAAGAGPLSAEVNFVVQ